MRDKLWFFVSGQAVDNSFVIAQNPNFPDHPPLQVFGFDGLAKLTWRCQHPARGQPEADRLAGRVQQHAPEPAGRARGRGPPVPAHRAGHPDLAVHRRAVPPRPARASSSSASTSARSRASGIPATAPRIPGELDVLTGILRQNYTSQTIDDRLKLQFTGDRGVHAGPVPGRRARPEVRPGTTSPRRTTSARPCPGDVVLNTIGGMPFSREEYCSNDPKLANGECRKNYLVLLDRRRIDGALSLSDRFRFSSYRYLTIHPGGQHADGQLGERPGRRGRRTPSPSPRGSRPSGTPPTTGAPSCSACSAGRRTPGSWRWPRSPPGRCTSRTAPGIPRRWPTCATAAARAATTPPPWACPAAPPASRPTARPAGRSWRPRACGKGCWGPSAS